MSQRVKPTLLGVLLVAMWLAAACASKGAPVSATHQQADQRFNAASRALALGQPERAVQQFQQAIVLYDGLYALPQRTQAVLGLSRALSESGRVEEAMQCVQQALTTDLALSAADRSQLLGRKASLWLAQGDSEAAATAALQAQTECHSRCPDHAALTVLQARIALARGAWVEGKDKASQASLLAADNPREQANALRVLAQAELKLQQAQAALLAAEQALVIDQRLGLPPRIALDLQLLAEAHAAAGDAARSAQYRQAAARARAALGKLD